MKLKPETALKVLAMIARQKKPAEMTRATNLQLVTTLTDCIDMARAVIDVEQGKTPKMNGAPMRLVKGMNK